MAEAKKVNLFQVIASAEISERIPRVPGAFHFALPFLADSTVDWGAALVDQIHPRATLISRYPALQADGTTPEPKVGQVYPTNLAVPYDVTNFLGVLIDGFDYDTDLNVTVTLAAGIPLIYLQGDPTAPHSTVDANVVAAADDLGLKIFNGQVFWNKVQ